MPDSTLIAAQPTPRRRWLLFVVAVNSIAVPSGCGMQPPAGQPAPLPTLKQTIDGIWKDASVASDGDYEAVADRAQKRPAPLDMRRMIIEWPQPREVRGAPEELNLGFENDSVTVSWSAEIGSGDEFKAARQRFTAILTEQGYRPLDKSKRDALSRAAGRRSDEREFLCRQIGGTELIVAYECKPYSGSSTYHSGVAFTWLARRPSRAPQPKLAEAFDALPAWMKVNYLNDQFYSSLADEPIASLVADRGLSIKFSRPVTDKLVAALEQNGFEYQRERNRNHDGSISNEWYRLSDITYASITSSADGKVQSFGCQTPQHQGPPITVRKPAQHPSALLPDAKRPILSLDDLTFTADVLRRQTKLFHALAESVAQKDWKVQGYKDERRSWDPLYGASWQTSVVKSVNYIPRVRPYQRIGIVLDGKYTEASDRLNSLKVSAVFVPAAGWAAFVHYSMSISTDGRPRPELIARVGLARDKQVFEFGNSSDSETPPIQRWVGASVSETSVINYSFHAQLPEADFEHSVKMLYSTPEALRDEILADIEALRKHSREDLDSGRGMEMTDMTGVRSARPPRSQPASERPPTDETKKALWAAVEKRLALQETTIRTNFREIHAAVQQALPLATMLGELTGKPANAVIKTKE